MRETFKFAQRWRMAGLVRRPRSPADLSGSETHAMQSLTFSCGGTLGWRTTNCIVPHEANS